LIKTLQASLNARALAVMPFQLVFTQGYERLALKFLKQHPELKNQYFKTLSLLELNPYHPSLRLHALSGKLQHLHSVSINLSYRITLELLIRDREIILIKVGDHSVVY
jgi:mRNA-degrading endonuclease YafQ of YafQ-DinJ toxin-antitoxin module